MRELKSTCRVAVVQATPVMFRKDKCLEKALRLIDEAAGEGAELIVFPELFIPGYPYGMTFGYTVGSRDKEGRLDWKRYYDNSLCVPGPETELLGQAAGDLRDHFFGGVGGAEIGRPDGVDLHGSDPLSVLIFC